MVIIIKPDQIDQTRTNMYLIGLVWFEFGNKKKTIMNPTQLESF